MKRTSKNDGELLLEIGTEEIPSGVLPSALAVLKDKALRFFSEARLPAVSVQTFATPRRLVLKVTGIPKRQEVRVSEVIGPPRSAAFDEQGNATTASTGFAESQGVSVDALTIKKTDKGEYVCIIRKEPTQPSNRILKKLLPELISSIEFPKMMRWDGHGLRFSRPIRWIVAVFEGTVVPFRLAGLSSGNLSRGHRFMANRSFVVKGWDDYQKELKRNHVTVDPAERERVIKEGLVRLARKKRSLVMDDAALLEQAVYLTEKPAVMLGGFDKRYLRLPSEILITAMKEHQGYFPVRNKNGSLMPYFLFVSNIKTARPSLIRSGNERVLRARLEDAQFYFEQDQKQKMEDRVGHLNEVVFHEKLGSVYHKSDRLGKLAETLLRAAGRDEKAIRRVRRAALLCKADLLTGMVREFPNLQGIVGREYARKQGEDPEVAEAIAEHYFPRHAEDQNDPRTITGKFVTAADRLDTLVGFFGVDLIPSGSMDPYALRRHGMGLIQILLDEAFSRVSLRSAIEAAAKLYPEHGVKLKKDPKTIQEVLERFLVQRMETYLKRRFDPAGQYRADLANAVLSRPFDVPVDLYRRFVALMVFHTQPGFEPLMVTFKRAARIVPEGFEGSIDQALFKDTVEHELYAAYRQSSEKIMNLLTRQQYPEVLRELAGLRQPIDRFFDGVLVMEEDPEIRANRLALLKVIRDLFGLFADFTRIVVTVPTG
jgi:glycyl-tRNA synthetase beta chain